MDLDNLGFTKEEQEEINEMVVGDVIFVTPTLDQEGFEYTVRQYMDQGYTKSEAKQFASQLMDE